MIKLLTFAIAIALTAGAPSLAQVAKPAASTASELTHEQALALVRSLQVASPYRINAAARAGEIRYRIALSDWSPPETGEQHVHADSDGVFWVSVCATCGSEAAPDAAQLQGYRSPNAWIESGDSAIIVFARTVPRNGNVHQRMLRMADAVRAHMSERIDFRRYDTAASALRTRSGDCTEVALLLAAVARAQGIPARIAYGLAYSSSFTGQKNVFSPHMWVQAWDGARWRSYDASLNGFDAAHIALAVGSGTPNGLEGLNPAIRRLRILDATGVRPAPEP